MDKPELIHKTSRIFLPSAKESPPTQSAVKRKIRTYPIVFPQKKDRRTGSIYPQNHQKNKIHRSLYLLLEPCYQYVKVFTNYSNKASYTFQNISGLFSQHDARAYSPFSYFLFIYYLKKRKRGRRKRRKGTSRTEILKGTIRKRRTIRRSERPAAFVNR